MDFTVDVRHPIALRLIFQWEIARQYLNLGGDGGVALSLPPRHPFANRLYVNCLIEYETRIDLHDAD